MVHPCCGMSLQKAARNIAIIDLVICVVSATIRLTVFDIQEYSEYNESPTLETSAVSHINRTVGINQIEEQHASLRKEESVGKTTQYIKSKIASESRFTTSSPVGSGSTVKSALTAHNKRQDPVLIGFVGKAIIGCVIFIPYVVLEVWLCRLLLAGSSNRDSFVCKRWFWVRLTLTVLGLIFGIFAMVTLRYAWIEWLLELVMFYRAYELYVVNEFLKEIVTTTGIIRPRI